MTEPGLDVAALHAALDRERGARRCSWRQIARETGVSISTLSRLGQGHRPDVDGYARLVRWLGASADAFLRPDAAAPLPGAAADMSPPAAIGAYLRARRELTPEATAMLEEIVASAYAHLAGAAAEDGVSGGTAEDRDEGAGLGSP